MTKPENSLSRRNLLAGTAGALTLATLSDGGFSSASAAAPLQGASTPTHYRFRLGSFEITTINDGAVQLDGPHPIFGQNVEAKEVQDLAVKNFLPPTRMEIGFTPVIVNTGKELILFDTGNGDRNRPKTGQLAAGLAQAGLSVGQIDKVVITHAHPDHISGLIEDGKPIFPNAQYFMSAAEYDFWSPKDKLTGNTERVAKLVQSKVVPLADRFTFIKNEQSVASGITALDAFGHTPGHTIFHIESEGKRLMLMADTVNHFVASLQRPDWHVRFDMDKAQAGATRKRLFDMLAKDRIAFAGYHMPFPALGFIEKSDGPSYRYIPVSYQFNV